jgi:hypothetical protein
MEIDDRITLVKKLIAHREEIDQQLAALFGGELPEKKERRCGSCGEIGHQARHCPKKANSEIVAQ